MFARKSCYFFVRPKKSFLEVCVFLDRPLKAPQVRRVDRVSKSKVVHFLHIRHRDEVEAPVTDWLQEAYELSEVPGLEGQDRTRDKRRPAAGRARKKPAKAVRKRTTARKAKRR